MSSIVPWGVVSVPYERTTSYHTGAALGPEAILKELNRSFPREGRPARVDRVAGSVLRLPRTMVTAAGAAVAGQVADGLLPVMLGGEHTCTLGPVTALRQLHRELAVVHLDAHADQRSSYGGTRYSHASVMRRLSQDFDLPVLSIGVRALSAAEARYIEGRGIGLLPGEKLREWRTMLPPLLRGLPRVAYLTVDMDFFDPAVVPGVGTPEPGGARWREAEGIIAAVTSARQVVGFDIVELCPPREKKRSAAAALRVMKAVLDGISRFPAD